MEQNLRISAFSFATPFFLRAGRILGATCLHQGFRDFTLFEPVDLESSFKEKNSEILSHSRGAGYWLWKPYLLSRCVEETGTNEAVLYLDCGLLPRKNAAFYSDLLVDDRIHVWETEGQVIQDWTEPDVLKVLKVPDALQKNPLVMGGAILARQNKLAKDFSKLWLRLCENPDLLCPDAGASYTNPKSIVWHRHDQSILSVIVALHPDWFHIHSKDKDGLPYDSVFDLHRNSNLKVVSVILTFPQVRKLRQQIVKRFPKVIRRILRNSLFNKTRKPISEAEINAIKGTF